jgi:hypothetical protein
MSVANRRDETRKLRSCYPKRGNALETFRTAIVSISQCIEEESEGVRRQRAFELGFLLLDPDTFLVSSNKLSEAMASKLEIVRHRSSINMLLKEVGCAENVEKAHLVAESFPQIQGRERFKWTVRDKASALFEPRRERVMRRGGEKKMKKGVISEENSGWMEREGEESDEGESRERGSTAEDPATFMVEEDGWNLEFAPYAEWEGEDGWSIFREAWPPWETI